MGEGRREREVGPGPWRDTAALQSVSRPSVSSQEYIMAK